MTYIAYHPVTSSLWAIGPPGIILKRSVPSVFTTVNPRGKAATSWGAIKRRTR
jgi:hypothetical protein